MQVGLTSGCFDLLHFGHLRYLESCKALCDTLLVGIDSDLMVQATKGPERPFVPELERLQLIRSQRCVDAAFLIHRLEDLRVIALQFKVNRVFKHEGFKEIKNVIGVEGTGTELVIVPDVPGLVSTTELVERIRSRKQPERPRGPSLLVLWSGDQPPLIGPLQASSGGRLRITLSDVRTPQGHRDAIRYHAVRAWSKLPVTVVLDENGDFVVLLAGVLESVQELSKKLDELGYRSWAKQFLEGAGGFAAPSMADYAVPPETGLA